MRKAICLLVVTALSSLGLATATTTSAQADVPADNPSIAADAAGSYLKTWAWTIGKSVDRTSVTQETPSSVTLHYTVTVGHDTGTLSNITVAGSVDVLNGNFDDSFNTTPLDLSALTVTLSDSTSCVVDTSGGLTLSSFQTFFPYTCSLTSLPTSPIDAVATASWSTQSLSNGSTLTADSASYTFPGVEFESTARDDAASVSDSYAGNLGVVSAENASPATFTYDRTLNITATGCTSYNNTATLTTNTTGTTTTASASASVCGLGSGTQTKLTELANIVQGLAPGSALLNKVRRIQAEVAAGNLPGACTDLNGFISLVKAQKDKKIKADATDLISRANAIKTLIGC